MKIINPRRLNLALVGILFLLPSMAYAAVPSSPTGEDLTLWQTLVGGGSVMIVIGLLSLLAVALIIYDFMNLNVNKLTPHNFYAKVIRRVEERDMPGLKELCLKENNNLLAKIVLAGTHKANKGFKDPSFKEAMEQHARIEVGNLWQNLNYLSDIVAVAPLLGLLGTVLGMIQAFHAVPIQSAGIKTSLLVAGISKAMVTTASGLIIAIPVLMAYSYFRGQIQQITNKIEIYCTDIIKIIENS